MIDPVYPSLALVVTYLAASLLTSLRSETQKRAVQHAFGHYISHDLMEELTESRDKLKLGGETREITVMFTDIRNFTSIAEGMDPESLIRLMNDFLTPMTERVMKNRGTIDKYMGDAMMAFWNAPLDDAEHVKHACVAALEMKDALAPVNAALEARCKTEGRHFMPLQAGIGLNSGPCSIGNMGSKQRFAYSALGDTVNLASRLEGQTKIYGMPIILGEATKNAVPDFAFLELDLIQVKGKMEPVRIFALMGDEQYAQSDKFKSLKDTQIEMLDAYRRQAFDEALDILKTLRIEGGTILGTYCNLFEERITQHQKQNPGPSWTGVHVAISK